MLALLAFVIVVVSTPITRWPVFIGFLVVLVASARWARIPLRTFFARAVIEVPFVFFAVLMPLSGTGSEIPFGPLTLHSDGIVAGASILVKGTLGVLAAVLLSTTTTARDLLRGLERLRMPRLMVEIASFMLRYVNVVNDEMERMRTAREARGFEASGIKHWRVLASAAGALFIRSYERGERVHLAMLSRAYTGRLPGSDHAPVTAREWLTAASLPLGAALVAIIGGLLS